MEALLRHFLDVNYARKPIPPHIAKFITPVVLSRRDPVDAATARAHAYCGWTHSVYNTVWPYALTHWTARQASFVDAIFS